MIYDPRDTQDSFDTTLMGPGFFVFFQRNIIESAGWFDYPDSPPKRKKKRKEKKIDRIIEVIAKKCAYRPQIDQELALRLALVNEKMRYNDLYLRLLALECKKRKKRRKAIILLLTGD